MVCVICRNMLGRQEGRFAKGTLDIRYEHHTTVKTFQEAVRQDCYICRALFRHIVEQLPRHDLQSRQDSIVSRSHTLQDEALLQELARGFVYSKAFLSLEKVDHSYRLEIELRYDQAAIRHKFRLECRRGGRTCPDQRSVHVKYRNLEAFCPTPFTAPHSSSHRDYGKAIQWLKECMCHAPQSHSFYPTRLLSLKSLKASLAKYGNSVHRSYDSQAAVYLIDTASWSREGFGHGEVRKHYVTLSHCWGGHVSHRLLRDNYSDFVRGIPVLDLPKSFQDAIFFASSIEEVDFIWIDSLCIIQEDEDDWLKEAAMMGRVYSETYLNLSATAAVNSTGGLFKYGDFELLDEDEITLNIEGLPMAYDRKTSPRNPNERKSFFLRECTIVDASFWEIKVDKGPVNTRGWVLQERLMSSRVLHFCRDQVGWECACLDLAQNSAACRATANTKDRQSTHDGIVQGIQQRRLKMKYISDDEISTPGSPFDLWAAVVNTYSKTAITKPKDKLIALSGLARIISKETGCAYVAGLWRTHLASQLLWRVEPTWRETGEKFEKQFLNLSKRPADYCAPSWSWAAIDADKGNGIAYAAISNQDLYIKIKKVATRPRDKQNEYGIVESEGTYIDFWGKLHPVVLYGLLGKQKEATGRFAWRLLDRAVYDEEHTNVYLDCPADASRNGMLGYEHHDSHVFVIPIARGPRAETEKNKYLMCLLVQRVAYSEHNRLIFKRVGFTKLSPWADRKALSHILKVVPNGASIPYGTYDVNLDMHKIRLI